MTHTRRRYNDPHSPLYVHSHHQVCMGHCPFCRDSRKEPKMSRLERERELRQTLEYFDEVST